MCSGISFFVGLFLLFKGNFRFRGRNVPQTTGRFVGLLLMAPLVLGFLYGIITIGQSENFSPDILENPALLNAALVEMFLLVVALIVAGYMLFSLPVEAPLVPTARWQGGPMPVTPEYGKVMTTAEVAQYLRIPEFEVITLIEDGKLPAARIGSDYRIARSVVEDFLNTNGGAGR
jgi:excisionase family DNA binding protein